MIYPQHTSIFKSDHVKRFLDWFEALEVGISKLGKVIRLFVQSTLAFNGVISHHYLFQTIYFKKLLQQDESLA
jgi:hypothetical protein